MMKIVFIHIPKTAGSSFSTFLINHAKGNWLPFGAIKLLREEQIQGHDFLAGHFTMSEFLDFARRVKLDISKIHFMTCVRNPLDQLYSNLSFPFELKRRNDPAVESDWFRCALQMRPDNPEDILSILYRFPFLTNMQSRYLFEDDIFDTRFDMISHISIFPDVSSMVEYAKIVLNVSYPISNVHENKQGIKEIDPAIFEYGDLQEYILSAHARDYWMFRKIINRIREKENNKYKNIDVPIEFRQFYTEWIQLNVR